MLVDIAEVEMGCFTPLQGRIQTTFWGGALGFSDIQSQAKNKPAFINIAIIEYLTELSYKKRDCSIRVFDCSFR